MKTLLNGRFAPITNSWGFLEQPFDILAKAMEDWLFRIRPPIEVQRFNANLSDALDALEPLNIRKTLLTSTFSQWTAVFANNKGSGPQSEIGFLSKSLRCRGLLVTCVEDTFDKKSGKGQFGGVQFELFAPDVAPGEILNDVRAIGALNEGERWSFVNIGPPEPFETPDCYEIPNIQERFTCGLLEKYCHSLGIRLFDTGFYGPRCALFKSKAPPSHDFRPETLASVRACLGLDE